MLFLLSNNDQLVPGNKQMHRDNRVELHELVELTNSNAKVPTIRACFANSLATLLPINYVRTIL